MFIDFTGSNPSGNSSLSISCQLSGLIMSNSRSYFGFKLELIYELRVVSDEIKMSVAIVNPMVLKEISIASL